MYNHIKNPYDSFEPKEDKSTYLDDFSQMISLKLDDILTVDDSGSWDYQDLQYTWARNSADDRGFWHTDKYNIFLASPEDIVEAVDSMLEDLVPDIPGKYHVVCEIEIYYVISGVTCARDYFEDADGNQDYFENVYTDDATVRVDNRQSTIRCTTLDKIQ